MMGYFVVVVVVVVVVVAVVEAAVNCCCGSHINSHNQVRGHRTGSSHSGAEEYLCTRYQAMYTINNVVQ